MELPMEMIITIIIAIEQTIYARALTCHLGARIQLEVNFMAPEHQRRRLIWSANHRQHLGLWISGNKQTARSSFKIYGQNYAKWLIRSQLEAYGSIA